MRNFAALAVTAAMFVAAPAYAASYTTDTVTFSGVGDQIGSTFDQVTLGGVSGTFTNPGVYALNNISFVVGINANSLATTSGIFSNLITIGSSSYTYNVPYTITIGAPIDVITFNASTVTLGGYTFTVNPLTLSTGNTTTGVLTANVATAAAVPEVATWAMMLAGFGMIGFAARRRQSVKTAVTFA